MPTTELACVYFENARDNVPQRVDDSTWSDVSEWLLSDPQIVADPEDNFPDDPVERKKIVDEAKKQLLSLSFTRYGEGAKRGDAGVEALSAIALDFDKGVTVDALEALLTWLQGVGYVAHTTFGSALAGDGLLKLRVVIPFAREVAPDEYAQIWFAVAARVKAATGLAVDEACKNVGRIFFAPGCFKMHAQHHQRWHGIGGALDVDALLASMPDPERAPPSTSAKAPTAPRERAENDLDRAIRKWNEANPFDPPSARFECVCGSSDGAALLPDGKIFCHGAKHAQNAPHIGSAAGNGYIMERFEFQLGLTRQQVIPKLTELGLYTPPSALSRKPAAANNQTSEVAADEERTFEFRAVSDVFAPKPPKVWLCPTLHLAPDRPCMFVGRSSSFKTWAAMDLALAVATGGLAWGIHRVTSGIVVHLDYEMGESVERRYAELALGRGITDPETALDGKLRLARLPAFYLTDHRASEALLRAAKGAKLVVIDSLVAGWAGIDESDTETRKYLDQLTRISDITGATFVVIHHAGKGDLKKDIRNAARGASALVDASSCVWVFDREPGSAGALVKQAKQGDGEPCAPQQIELRDWARGKRIQSVLPQPDAKDEQDMQRVLALIRARAAEGKQTNHNALVQLLNLGDKKAKWLAEELEQLGRVVTKPGARNAKNFLLTDAEHRRGGK